MKLRELLTTPQPGTTVSRPTAPTSATTPVSPIVQVTPQQISQQRAAVGAERDKKIKAAQAAAQTATTNAQKEYQTAIQSLRSTPMGMVEQNQLNEYSLDFADDLTNLIKNQVGRANGERKPSFLSYQALSKMLGNIVGQSIVLDKNTLQTIYNEHPNLANYIEEPGTDGITLSTKVTPSQTKLDNPVNGGKELEQMATSGANYLGRSRNNP